MWTMRIQITKIITNKITLLILFLIGLAYYYPRILSDYLGEDHYLSSYLYIYVFGLIFFIVNMRLLIHSKAINLSREGERKWMWFFIACLFWECVCMPYGFL